GKSSFFIKADSCLFRKIYPNEGLHEVMLAIASGKIIKVKYLKDVGFMKEDLFIDWVDIEWCWRAIKKQYKIIGNANIVIKHHHGQSSIQIGNRIITVKKPIRQYYHVRNAFYLGIYSDVLPFKCRIIHLLKAIRYTLLYPILVKPHFTNLKYCLLGFWHGITKRLGRLE
ncbi:MAG: glycosyltransferase family 2 protein, partial [Caldimicrobium sp.]